MKYSPVLAMGVFLLAGFLPGPLAAQEDPGVVRTGRLALTAQQQSQLQELRLAYRAENDEARAELIRRRAEVQALQAERDVDLHQLEQALNQLSELENAQAIRQMEHTRELAGVLTEQQRELFGARALLGRRTADTRLQSARRPARFDARFAGRMNRPGRGNRMLAGRGAGYGRAAGYGRRVGSGLGVGYGRGIGFNSNGWGGRGGRGAWGVGGGRGAGLGLMVTPRSGTDALGYRSWQRRMVPPEEGDLTGYRRQYLEQRNLQDRPLRRGLQDSTAAWSRAGRGRGTGRIIPPER